MLRYQDESDWSGPVEIGLNQKSTKKKKEKSQFNETLAKDNWIWTALDQNKMFKDVNSSPNVEQI